MKKRDKRHKNGNGKFIFSERNIFHRSGSGTGTNFHKVSAEWQALLKVFRIREGGKRFLFLFWATEKKKSATSEM